MNNKCREAFEAEFQYESNDENLKQNLNTRFWPIYISAWQAAGKAAVEVCLKSSAESLASKYIGGEDLTDKAFITLECAESIKKELGVEE